MNAKRVPPRNAVIPRATYRLQLHKGFDFDAARAVLPYLHRLGISHVYCSPVTCARPGSLHGYDVIDPTRINPELGGEAGFEFFASAARALDIGLLLDQVPNHMGVFGADNAWWSDVLENGQASEYAAYFDIEWQPVNRALAGKVLVPVLGDSYGELLERGEIRLGFDAAREALVFDYHEHRFPLDPHSYAAVLRPSAHPALQTLAEAFDELPPRDADDPALRAVRRSTQRILQARLARTLAEDADAARALAANIEALNAASNRDALDALHEAQAFRLAHWRTAADEINYRRFFDINELAAMRIEDERVFDATQGPTLALAAAGVVDGLRIDHPDGLYDPAEYFRRLQQGYARRRGWPVPEGNERPLYVIAEKIAAGFEDVPTDWAVHGTTGYRFAMLVNGLFVERRSAKSMERIWRNDSGVLTDYAEMVFDGKRAVARGALGSQLTELAHALHRIALTDRRTRDHGFNTLRDTLAEVAASMPVYRTYIVGSAPASTQDRRFIDWAVAQAQRRGDPADTALFAFVRRSLLGEAAARSATEPAPPDLAEQVRSFAMRFQQFCAPVAAKGVEDTAFYRYHRLVSLNEVGGDPAVFGISAAAFHGASADRAQHWPHTMLATSTHDNKRAEDVRCRIDVLSEQPAAWRLAVRRWRTATRAWRSVVDGVEAPSAADRYLLHQTLLGTLPVSGLAADELAPYRERIERYIVKAAREAKVQTRWTRPNAGYEAALAGFVRGLLGRIEGNPVLAELQARVAGIAWYGALNSLAMTLLKFTSPGVPDLYQGTELIDLSLVDPDNRRPVDYSLREQLLAGFEAALASPAALLEEMSASPTDGRMKLWLIWRLLALRRAQPQAFDAAKYVPLRVQGTRRRNVIAFARRAAGSTLIVIAGRKFAGLPSEPGQMPLGAAVWGDTTVQRPAWLTDDVEAEELVTCTRRALGTGAIELADIFRRLPIAALQVPHAAIGGLDATADFPV